MLAQVPALQLADDVPLPGLRRRSGRVAHDSAGVDGHDARAPPRSGPGYVTGRSAMLFTLRPFFFSASGRFVFNFFPESRHAAVGGASCQLPGLPANQRPLSALPARAVPASEYSVCVLTVYSISTQRVCLLCTLSVLTQ